MLWWKNSYKVLVRDAPTVMDIFGSKFDQIRNRQSKSQCSSQLWNSSEVRETASSVACSHHDQQVLDIVGKTFFRSNLRNPGREFIIPTFCHFTILHMAEEGCEQDIGKTTNLWIGPRDNSVAAILLRAIASPDN